MDSELSKDRGSFGEIAAAALRYWEPRRALYNLALTAVVAAHFFAAWPASRPALAWNTLFLLIFLAVLANVCYCATACVPPGRVGGGCC